MQLGSLNRSFCQLLILLGIYYTEDSKDLLIETSLWQIFQGYIMDASGLLVCLAELDLQRVHSGFACGPCWITMCLYCLKSCVWFSCPRDLLACDSAAHETGWLVIQLPMRLAGLWFSCPWGWLAGLWFSCLWGWLACDSAAHEAGWLVIQLPMRLAVVMR